jgi:hypothetical protein
MVAESLGSFPEATSTARMMPIVFCASFPPWPRLYAAADTSCNLRNSLLTREGESVPEGPVGRDHEDPTQGHADDRCDEDEGADPQDARLVRLPR